MKHLPEELLDEQDILYTPIEVARLFRVDPKTISRWQKRGRFDEFEVEVLYTIGGHRRFRKVDIDKLLERLALEGEQETEMNRHIWEESHKKDGNVAVSGAEEIQRSKDRLVKSNNRSI